MCAVHPSLPLLALLALAAGCSHAPKSQHWSYEGPAGPARWAELTSAYAACREGHRQSPVDIATGTAVRLTGEEKRRALRMYLTRPRGAASEVNTGHTIQVNHAGGDTLEIGGTPYALVQYHFHAPSEHTVDGRQFPMEVHFVHQAADGRLAVVGVLLVDGQDNPALEATWSHMPRQKGAEASLEQAQVAMEGLLPAVRTAWRYEGSLTTPPCSEGVEWLVMNTPVEVGAGQIARFRAIVHDNHRPTQPLNGRVVLTETVVAER